LDYGLLGVLAGERAYVVHAGEERDGGEHHLVAVVAAEQAGTAKAGGLLEGLRHLRFVMVLVVVGHRFRGPSSPCPRDHSLHLPFRGLLAMSQAALTALSMGSGSRGLPRSKRAPARTSATRWGAFTARHRARGGLDELERHREAGGLRPGSLGHLGAV